MFENSRSQIVFRTDIFRKLTLGAPIQPSTDSADCTPAVVVFEVPSVLDVESGKQQIKETMKSTTGKWYYGRWTFRKHDDLGGERRTSYEKQQKENTYPLQRGENSTKLCPTAGLVNAATGTVVMRRNATCRRIYIALNTNSSHPVISNTIGQL